MHDVADQCNRPGPDTYTPEFTDIVHELRGHIGAMRKTGAPLQQ